MPRIRAVDPFGSQRHVRRPARTGPTPDPNAELLAPGELARRVAAAMSKRAEVLAEPTAGEILEDIEALVDEESPTFDEESPGESPGDYDATEGTEPHSEPQGGQGDDVEGWPSAVAVAEVLGVDPAEVRRRCREGELDAVKDAGGAWRINPAALASS